MEKEYFDGSLTEGLVKETFRAMDSLIQNLKIDEQAKLGQKFLEMDFTLWLALLWSWGSSEGNVTRDGFFQLSFIIRRSS